ncbi:ABC transporter, transmembrane ATP-binding protein [Oceanicola granulosus HTCC2516]|uniref:ABC transporter, transmembrane ATP-binding protein n=1 Tax=Oceanicola granulosus (strain ATCC BAA-861 / DSM 15982 / KCTC 12143 / HTCC2516) TaxID=314256 RepID=Q2CJS1_OCEGH|nr:ABC transporter ATP-binding protein [Oceanicola granulosus]EAR53068.1 ABC transporter, transmembrane ATP-binding protein [Oceanicola granulosus HTCC2516]
MFRFFESLVDPYTPYEDVDRPPQRLWPFLKDYLRPFRKMLGWTAFVAGVVAAIEVWQIWYLGRFVDVLTTTPRGEVWALYGVEFVAVALFLLLIRPVIYSIHAMLLNNTMVPNLGALVRWRSHRHVLRQSVGWFENDFAGRIANRIAQTPTATVEAVFQVFDAVSYAAAYTIGAAVLLWGADPILLWPLGFWLLLYIGLLRWTVRRVEPAAKASSDARSEFTGRVVDSYTNINSVKMFAHHDTEVDYARGAIDKTLHTVRNEQRIFSKMDIGLTVINGVLLVAVVGWATLIYLNGNATVGIVAAASALTLRLSAMTGWIMFAVTNLFRNLGIVAEGMETISQPVTLTDAPDARELAVTEGRLDVRGLSHHYGKRTGGLDRVTLSIPPGQKVGLVGRSGAGKSTLVKLLLRFYDAEAGRIEIDGQDISRVTQDSLRRAIGMVQQDSALLHRSVRDNILYGNPGASEEQMIEAARRAEAHDFILGLEDGTGRSGYDAQVGERGVKLSGGQRQRIALARVILKDAPLLVLDEATSALDSEVEAAIQETLYGMMEGKTVIAIAHRLSTIARMDRIVVMDEGRIIEDGPHDTLLARGGLYATLWSRQSGGFLGADFEDDPEAAE